jgi:hypothetical protein
MERLVGCKDCKHWDRELEDAKLVYGACYKLVEYGAVLLYNIDNECVCLSTSPMFRCCFFEQRIERVI